MCEIVWKMQKIVAQLDKFGVFFRRVRHIVVLFDG